MKTLLTNDTKFLRLAIAYARSYTNLNHRKCQGTRYRQMTSGKALKLARQMRGTDETVQSLMAEFHECVADIISGKSAYLLVREQDSSQLECEKAIVTGLKELFPNLSQYKA